MEEKILTCYADSCMHNNNLKCQAGKILIGNPSATTTSEARCKIYEKGENNNFKSQLQEYLSETVEVRCSAKNCEYNNSKKCSAKELKINARTGSCETFIPNYKIIQS